MPKGGSCPVPEPLVAGAHPGDHEAERQVILQATPVLNRAVLPIVAAADLVIAIAAPAEIVAEFVRGVDRRPDGLEQLVVIAVRDQRAVERAPPVGQAGIGRRRLDHGQGFLAFPGIEVDRQIQGQPDAAGPDRGLGDGVDAEIAPVAEDFDRPVLPEIDDAERIAAILENVVRKTFEPDVKGRLVLRFDAQSAHPNRRISCIRGLGEDRDRRIPIELIAAEVDLAAALIEEQALNAAHMLDLIGDVTRECAPSVPFGGREGRLQPRAAGMSGDPGDSVGPADRAVRVFGHAMQDLDLIGKADVALPEIGRSFIAKDENVRIDADLASGERGHLLEIFALKVFGGTDRDPEIRELTFAPIFAVLGLRIEIVVAIHQAERQMGKGLVLEEAIAGDVPEVLFRVRPAAKLDPILARQEFVRRAEGRGRAEKVGARFAAVELDLAVFRGLVDHREVGLREDPLIGAAFDAKALGALIDLEGGGR